VQGYNSKNKKDICYPIMLSAMRPAAHGCDMPIPTPPETLDTSPSESEYDVSDCDDVDFQPTTSSARFRPSKGLCRDFRVQTSV
jgi:hypothetical protein